MKRGRKQILSTADPLQLSPPPGVPRFLQALGPLLHPLLVSRDQAICELGWQRGGACRRSFSSLCCSLACLG